MVKGAASNTVKVESLYPRHFIMKFYHGTSEEKWKLIQEEGVLWGYRIHDGHKTLDYRYTYLSPHLDVAKEYGDVILEVEYEPVGVDGRGIDNYGYYPLANDQSVWQFSVFVPIPIEKITRLASV